MYTVTTIIGHRIYYVTTQITVHNEKVDLFWKNKVADFQSVVQEWRSDIDDLHTEVNEKGDE